MSSKLRKNPSTNIVINRRKTVKKPRKIGRKTLKNLEQNRQKMSKKRVNTIKYIEKSAKMSKNHGKNL